MKKILIIEDEPDAAESMKLILEKAGYHVEYTLDPKKGLAMVKKFDLLCLDLLMPITSGRAVLIELNKRKIRVPVVIVSAVGFTTEMYTELQSKYPGLVMGFVQKPFIQTDLAGEVKKHIGK